MNRELEFNYRDSDLKYTMRYGPFSRKSIPDFVFSGDAKSVENFTQLDFDRSCVRGPTIILCWTRIRCDLCI